jgi:hypothetical protein
MTVQKADLYCDSLTHNDENEKGRRRRLRKNKRKPFSRN